MKSGYPGGILNTASSNYKKAADGEGPLPQNKFQEKSKMDKVIVAYRSRQGNTAAMAVAVSEGITEAGKEAVVTDISSFPWMT